MTSRKPPIEVVKREFDVDTAEPYYWVQLDQPVSNSTLAETLDASTVRFDPETIGGLIHRRAFNDGVFVFLHNGATLVDLVSQTAEDARARIDEFLSTLTARGVLDAADHTAVQSVSRESQRNVPTIDSGPDGDVELAIQLDGVEQGLVAQALFAPRNRLDFPEQELTLLFADLDSPGPVVYEDRDGVGLLHITASPDGTAFAGLDAENEFGVVFTRHQCCYQFEYAKHDHVAVGNEGAIIIGRSRPDPSVDVYGPAGALNFSTDVESLADVTISGSGEVFGYTTQLDQYTAVLCEQEADGTVTQTHLDGYAAIEYEPERRGFQVAEAPADAFSKIIAPDGTVIEEFDLETSRGDVDELLARLDEGAACGVVNDLRAAVDEQPDAFAEHVPALVTRLANDEFPASTTPTVSSFFQALVVGVPEAFESSLDTVIKLLDEADQNQQHSSAARILSGLLGAGVQRDRIASRLREMIVTGDVERQRRALLALRGLPAEALVDAEETLTSVLELLDEEMPPELMLPVVNVLSVHPIQSGSEAIADAVVEAEKTAALVSLLRYGYDRRGATVGGGTELAVSVSIGEDSGPDDPSDSRGVLDNQELYSLNKTAADLLSTVTAERPAAVVPYLDRLLLDVESESDSLQVVRENAVEIIELLLDQEPAGLQAVAERNIATIIDLFDHEEGRVRTLSVELAAVAGTDRARQAIQAIAETPSHELWNTATNVLDDRLTAPTDSDSAPIETAEATVDDLTRLAQLPVRSEQSLQLPGPAELQSYRESAGMTPNDIAELEIGGREGDSRYIEWIEDGVVSPRLSVLADIVFAIQPEGPVVDRFPSGPRLEACREAAGISRGDLTDRTDITEGRLAAIETNRADPQAHEVERLVAALEGRDSVGEYPARLTVRESWVEYGTQLATALGRFPKAGEIVQYTDIEDHPAKDETDTGFAGSEGVDLSVDMPELPYWVVFDGWDELLASLDVDTEYRTSGSPLRSSLIEELRAVNQVVSGRPTTSDIDQHSDYSYHYYKKEFGSMKAAIEAGGLA